MSPVLTGAAIVAAGRAGLIGPAGGGKTTFLRSLNRMNNLDPRFRSEGALSYRGTDLRGAEVDVAVLRRKLGMVFAVPVPLPGTILQNLLLGPKLMGLSGGMDARVEKSLRAAYLWDEVKDRLALPAPSLSGGQQQRLCLARSLALEPEVIVLDNPTSGLDPLSTAAVEASLEALKERYTIIMVPHSVQQAARVADSAAFLLDGELIETGPAAKLFSTPLDSRTEDYVIGRFG